MTPFRVNLPWRRGGAGVLNQQGSWVFDPSWASSRTSQTLSELVADGHDFLICPNLVIALPNDCADEVITNSLPPFDTISFLGPTVQTSEIRRILKRGGFWINDGQIKYVKP